MQDVCHVNARACRIGTNNEGGERNGSAYARADEGPVHGDLRLIIVREEHCGLIEEHRVFTIWIPSYLIRRRYGINIVLRVRMMAGGTLTVLGQ